MDKVKIVEHVLGTGILSADIISDAPKCMGSRHRKITCRRCVEICPAAAIDAQSHSVTINDRACTHCGACIAVCPTQALRSDWLPWDKLFSNAVRSSEATRGDPIVACSIALDDIDDYDHAKVVGVPCLDGVDEALIVAIAATGADGVRLVHGDCESCDLGCMGAVWTLVTDYAHVMLESVDCDFEIEESQGLPADAFDIENVNLRAGSFSRRDMFESFGTEAKRVVGTVATDVMEESSFRQYARLLGLTSEASPLAKATRGQICEWALGAIALFPSKDTEHDGQGEQTEQVEAKSITAEHLLEQIGDRGFESRVFSGMSIDGEKCVNCFLCVAYCRSKALEKLMDGPRVIGFKEIPSSCTQCGACIDMCRQDAITLDGQITLRQLLAHEPVLIEYSDWDAQRQNAKQTAGEQDSE